MGGKALSWIEKLFTGRQIKLFVIAALAAIIFPLNEAHAFKLEDPLPAYGPGNRNVDMHFHPIHKEMRLHTGQDVPTDGATPLIHNTPGFLSFNCLGTNGGYGEQAEVIYECNVKVVYSHLSDCEDTNGKTNAYVGTTGSSTGEHLHYEVYLGGARVQPETCIGSGKLTEGCTTTAIDEEDLCNAATREKLIREANIAMNGGAGKDGTVTPSDKGIKKSTHVPANPSTPGSTIPDGTGGTITLPPGGGYIITEYEDGRVVVTPEVGDSTEIPTLPPGDPADLTPEGTAEHEVTGCATDTWKAMVNQSVLQARRETMFNQRFIAKGDGVMAYACLNKAMDRVRMDLGPVFSETKRWVNAEVDILGKTVIINKELGEYSLDGALVNAAYTPYETWHNTNFSHEFLGGLAESLHEEESGEDSHTHDQSYTSCSIMQDVWKAAKCLNMNDEPMFPKFEELIENSSDPRKYPHTYQCNYTGISQAMIDTAKGKEVKFDKVVTHLSMLYPDEEGKCHPPIRTGVTVVRMETQAQPEMDCFEDPACSENKSPEEARIAQQKEFPDGLCITAGCSYQNTDGKAGECVVK